MSESGNFPFHSDSKQEKKKDQSGHCDSKNSVQTSVVLGREFREGGGREEEGGGVTAIETICLATEDGNTAWISENSWLVVQGSSSAQGPNVIS